MKSRPLAALTGRLTLLALAAGLVTGCMTKDAHLKEMDGLKAQLQRKCADELAEQKRLEDEQRRLAQNEKDRADRTSDELDRTKRALNDCTSAGGDSSKKLAECQLQRDEARDRLERVSASINKVRDALKAMSDAGKLQVKVQRGFLVIALQGDILFDTGKSRLKDEAKPILIELAEILKSLSDRMFQVAGHTDNTGSEDLNWELSMQRALTVVRFLIKDGGVGGANLSAGGYAMYQPVADNSTDQGKQINRRVEFLLIPNLADLLTLK